MLSIFSSFLIPYRFVEQCIEITDSEYNEIKIIKPTKDIIESYCMEIEEVGNELKFSFDIIDRNYILVISAKDNIHFPCSQHFIT